MKNTRNDFRAASLLSTLILLACGIAAADVIERWHWRYPLPQGSRLVSVAYGGGQFVAVGRGGAIVTSSDGTNWVDRTQPVGLELRSVAYGNNRFVAVGLGGSLTSTNGLDWGSTSNAPPNQFEAVAFGTNLFVAVGYGIITTSPDGANWTTRSSPVLAALQGVAYGNGTFIAVGYDSILMTSADGIKWSTRNSYAGDLEGIIYADNIFVAIPSYNNNVLTSANGTSWDYHYFGGSTTYLYSIGHGPNGFVVMGDQVTVNSTDGTNWIRHNNLNIVEYDGIACGNGVYVAAGEGGTLQTSSDGVNWASQTGPHSTLNGVAYGSGCFVAVGGLGTILTSSNGVLWRPVDSGTSNWFSHVEYCNDRFVAVGTRYNASANIVCSSNGVNWVNCTGGEDDWLYAVCYGGGVHVAVGRGGTILASTNLLNWSPKPSGVTAWLTGVAYGIGQFIAVGDGGTIVASADGDFWAPRNSGASSYLNDVVFANGRFVVVGGDYLGNSTILTSTNGVDWQGQTSPTSETLWDIAFGNGLFLAPHSSSRPGIFYSTDGAIWKTATAGIADWPICHIAYGASTFVVAGNPCRILQSDSTTTPELGLDKLRDGSGVLLSVSGEVGRQYRLQYRSEFGAGQWDDLLSFTNNRPIVTFTNLTSDGHQFYRVVSP